MTLSEGVVKVWSSILSGVTLILMIVLLYFSLNCILKVSHDEDERHGV